MAGKTTSSTTPKQPRRTASSKAKSTVVELSTPSPKPRKSAFRAGTLIALLLLIGLIELAFYLKGEKAKTDAAAITPVSETAAIFAEDGIVSSIEIKPTEGETVKVTRNAENVWAVEKPIAAEADQGLVEAAATQVSALKELSRIEAGKSPSIFGLDKPTFIITVEFKDGKKRTLEVGAATPSNSGYYVRVDKDKMMITDLSGVQSLLQLVAFPPYLNTPTPTSLPPTETPVSPTEAGGTTTPAP